MKNQAPSGRPFVFLNLAMSADGKIATAHDGDASFGSRRDHDHMLELRATADAVMAGARTVDLKPVNLGPGPAKYRKLRLKNGLSEYNLRIVVSGAGTLNPGAEIFRHRFSPILLLLTSRVSQKKRALLRGAGAEVRVCGRKEIDFKKTFEWLRKKWNVKRLLCEGGGGLNGELFRQELVDEIHLTVCPYLLGGREAPTICDGAGFASLDAAARFKLVSTRRVEDEMFLVFRRRISGG